MISSQLLETKKALLVYPELLVSSVIICPTMLGLLEMPSDHANNPFGFQAAI